MNNEPASILFMAAFFVLSTVLVATMALLLLKFSKKISLLTAAESDIINIDSTKGWEESVTRLIIRVIAAILIVYSVPEIIEELDYISAALPQVLLRLVFIAVGTYMAFAPKWLVRFWGGVVVKPDSKGLYGKQ